MAECTPVSILRTHYPRPGTRWSGDEYPGEASRDQQGRRVLAILGTAACCAMFCVLQTSTPAYAQDQRLPETRSVWDGVYTPEQAKRGEAIYDKECSVCHGDTLNGTGEAPPLAGGRFLSNWDGLTVGDLFERIRKTMPQNKPARLTRPQDADVLAYMLSFNKFPSGKSELQHQAEWLKLIRFEGSKPKP